jgi:membrane-associated phospholipid phosphatase
VARVRWIVAIGASLACVALASLADGWTYHHVAMPRVYESDWGRTLRTFGYWPTWVIVAVAMWRHAGHRPADGTETRARSLGRADAAWLFGATTIAGIAAELVKLVIRRERPGLHAGVYGFRPWAERPFSSSGFGMPSSHAVEAFAAATVLAYCIPEVGALWYLLAIGCAVTRLLSGAHFLSDVVAGALMGMLMARALRRVTRRVDGGG